MPRVNRITRAINHENPLVGYIMVLQEKIKILGRSFVGCKCPEHEAQITSLQDQDFLLRDKIQQLKAELLSLQNKYQEISSHNTRLRTFMRTNGAKYRTKINSLLDANSTRLHQHTCQHKAYRAEIISLRSHVDKLQDILQEHEIPLPSPPPPVPWNLDVIAPSPTWTVNPEWSRLHFDDVPSNDPNNK